MRARDDRWVPVSAILEVLRVHAVDQFRIRNDVARLLISVAVFSQRAVDGRCIDERWIVRVKCDVRALATADSVVIILTDTAVPCIARNRHRAVVLLAGIESIRILVIGDDSIELRGGLVVDRTPGLAAVKGHICATVIRIDDVVAILRVKPHVVVIAMRRRHLLPILAAVDRLIQARVQRPDGIGIGLVYRNMDVVPGSRP